MGTVHAIATLVGIEAVLVTVSFALARGSWERSCLYLLGLTASLEVYRTTIADVNLSLFRISVGIALATVVGVRLRERHGTGRLLRARPSGISRIEATYILLAAVIAASFVAHGEALFLGKRLLAALVIYIVAIAVTAELTRRTSIHTLATALVAGAILPIVASFWQVLAPRIGAAAELPFLSSLPLGEGLEAERVPSASLEAAQAMTIRLKGTFADPNAFGSYLVFVTLLASGLAVESVLAGRRERATVFGGLAGATAATLVATYSRSAWGAAWVAGVTMVVLLSSTLRARTTRRQRRVAAMSAAVFVAIILVPLAPTISERLDPTSAANATTNAWHRSNGEAAIREFREHPVFGIGVGELGVRLGQQPRLSSADSAYLAVAAELGAVGLTALFMAGGFVLEALAGAYRRVRAGANALVPVALIGAYVGFLAANVFYGLWWRDFHFVVLGLIVAISAPRVASAGRPAHF